MQKSSSKNNADTYAYTYNKKGNRTSMTGGGVDTTSIYDNLGRLIKESLTDGTVKEYTYDINGNRKSFKLTKGNAVQYTLTYDYDKQNQLTKVYEDGTVKAEYTYNPDGTLNKSSYGSRTTDYSYNLANMLTEVNNANGSTQISKYSYTYYVDGNQKSKTESIAGKNKGTTNYTYDGLNRLIKEQAPDKTYSYQYDSYGNRSKLSVTGDETYTTSYTYDKNNRMRNQTKIAGSVQEITNFWYDPNGNQISSMTVSTGGTGTPGVDIELAGGSSNSVNEYNSWNQLTKTMQNGKTASYTYNGDGLRMSKTVDGTTTSHIWDGTNIAGDVTNGTVTKYIRGLQLISSKTGNSESFYNYNGHGDVVQLTNSSGSITKQYSYDAFGVEQNKSPSDTNPFRYCGEYYDKETDNIYLRARYYSPVQGRFTTEDPVKDGLNWYNYCNNDPIDRIDTTGMYYQWIRDVYAEQRYGFNVNRNSWGRLTVDVRASNQTIATYTDGVNGTKIYNGYMYIWIPPYTGSATPHKESNGGSRSTSQNCYTYATGLETDKSKDPGYISGVEVNFWDVYSVADGVVADLYAAGYGGRILGTGQSGISASIDSDEFRIAVRVGSTAIARIGNTVYNDYHFMVENSDGTWSEKHGPGGDAIKHELYETPQSIPWTVNGKEYYDSDIVYIAVRKNGN